MGTNQSGGEHPMSKDEQEETFLPSLLCDRSTCLEKFRCDALSDFTVLHEHLVKEREEALACLGRSSEAAEDRCIGSVLGLAQPGVALLDPAASRVGRREVRTLALLVGGLLEAVTRLVAVRPADLGYLGDHVRRAARARFGRSTGQSSGPRCRVPSKSRLAH